MLMLESEQDEGVQRKSLFNCTGSVHSWVELVSLSFPLACFQIQRKQKVSVPVKPHYVKFVSESQSHYVKFVSVYVK